MCIIVACEKGVSLPSKQILQNCWDSNSAGAGFMYSYNGLVHMMKGYMNFEEFYHELMQIDRAYDLKEQGCVLHFRIPTSGNTDSGNCHPFPITRDDEKLRETHLILNDVAMVHNGIVPMYNRATGVLNDTQLFIKHVVSIFYEYDVDFYKNKHVANLLATLAKSKLCFLNSEGEITRIGELDKYIKKDGVYYSNTSFKSYGQRYASKSYSGINYEDVYADALYSAELAELTGISIEECFDSIVNRLITLDIGETCYSADYEKEYVGNLTDGYAYDPSDNSLYNIDYKKRDVKYVNHIVFD